MANFDLTVIVPVYNEEESLERFTEEMDKFLQASTLKSNVLFVNDGSKDGSLQLVKEICEGRSAYSYISLDKNYGLSAAIKAGIDVSESKYVGYIDSDLQTSPMDFLNYFEFLPEYNMVNGIRKNRKDTVVKKASSKIANAFRRKMINDGIEDTGCPLKIIETAYAKKIPFFTGMHRFLPALIQLQGGKVKQIPVQHFPRFAGQSKYHLFNRLVGPFMDTLAFRWMRKRYIRYQISSSKLNG